mmetsp:Transcript_48830/g.156404  ORF Transcript_48830/g.156404 Transcript_48830/m.156404 type:complete len:226 (+) Transcript_48830:1049-1726(+)
MPSGPQVTKCRSTWLVSSPDTTVRWSPSVGVRTTRPSSRLTTMMVPVSRPTTSSPFISFIFTTWCGKSKVKMLCRVATCHTLSSVVLRVSIISRSSTIWIFVMGFPRCMGKRSTTAPPSVGSITIMSPSCVPARMNSGSGAILPPPSSSLSDSLPTPWNPTRLVLRSPGSPPPPSSSTTTRRWGRRGRVGRSDSEPSSPAVLRESGRRPAATAVLWRTALTPRVS